MPQHYSTVPGFIGPLTWNKTKQQARKAANREARRVRRARDAEAHRARVIAAGCGEGHLFAPWDCGCSVWTMGGACCQVSERCARCGTTR